MPELWSVHAGDEACDIAMRAPAAGRVAADEVMVAGPIASDLRRAIEKVDPSALIRDAAEGWTELVLPDGDARDVVARLSALELPDAPGFVQGDVARVAARVFVHRDRVRVFVPSSVEAHVRCRIEEALRR